MTHKGARDDLTAEYVRSVLNYDPETGVLTWRQNYHQSKIGKPAGSPQQPKNRIRVTINRHGYRAHRLIWLIMTGRWPPEEIDHRDRNPSNNRWNNLRLATAAQNTRNRTAHSNSGFKGVHFLKQKGLYQAGIKFHGNTEHLGFYETGEAAAAAYQARARELFGEFAHAEHVPDNLWLRKG